jgi:Uma2 family endonuclease
MTMDTHLITADELLKLPAGGYRYELVKGELLTMSPSGEEHGAVTVNLTFLLTQFVRQTGIGAIYGAETGFKLESNPDTVLAPDIAFIRQDRVGTRSKGYRLGAPDLAVEVLSPSDRKNRIQRKTAQWLALGARSVWLVDPETSTVEIHRIDGSSRIFHESEQLVDDDVLPGFRALVSDIFA